MATKTAEKDAKSDRTERAERSEKTETKESKTDRANMTADQVWTADQTKRAEERRDFAISEQERRAKLTPQELVIDDAKRQREAEAESRRWDALSQEEKNKELDDPKSAYYEPLPPWQTRLPSGKVFDARMNAQVFQHLLNTDGTTPTAGERQIAFEFLVEYMTSTEDENRKAQAHEQEKASKAKGDK